MPLRVFSDEEREELKKKMLEQAFPLLEEYGLKHMSVGKIRKLDLVESLKGIE